MLIQCTDLCKNYQDMHVIENLSLEIGVGTTVLLGNNGCGKSTLINLLVGNLRPSAGTITCDNENIHSKKYRNKLGYLPQECDFYPNFTGWEFLNYLGALKGMPARTIASEATKYLELYHLLEHKNRKIKNYSGGMKRRLGLCQAFMNAPDVLILDEPTTGLDYRERQVFVNQIKEYSRNHLILVATHIFEEAEAIADRYLVMKNGKIVFDTPYSEGVSVKRIFHDCGMES